MDNQAVITVPNIITAVRLLLGVAAARILLQGDTALALVIFTIAWALDAVDGVIARQFNQATSFGYLFDKVVDRALLVGAVVLLLRTAAIPPIAILIFTKDIATLPALGMQLTHRERIASLGTSGKILTLLQGLALLWIAVAGTYIAAISIILGVIGFVVGGRYVYHVVYRQ